ncbi:hypothetical protein VFPBJ_11426 [Purpureocillium lilacinum]|uniref:Uncharacterized protein n=1 Tax=Purpureocillium lilacinum TaxID=33203 RepID=A0A179FBJ8_PURLI|nr:hypothetical protein VFPBJ_11426 [Purpureocillium lilacinum]
MGAFAPVHLTSASRCGDRILPLGGRTAIGVGRLNYGSPRHRYSTRHQLEQVRCDSGNLRTLVQFPSASPLVQHWPYDQFPYPKSNKSSAVDHFSNVARSHDPPPWELALQLRSTDGLGMPGPSSSDFMHLGECLHSLGPWGSMHPTTDRSAEQISEGAKCHALSSPQVASLNLPSSTYCSHMPRFSPRHPHITHAGQAVAKTSLLLSTLVPRELLLPVVNTFSHSASSPRLIAQKIGKNIR